MSDASVAERPAGLAQGGAVAGGAPAYFSCRDLHAYYGESYIVQGVSFELYEGEILALLGRNGAGKTSTLRTIARLADPELRHGEIWLAGQPLHRMPAWRAARSGVGLVPEDRRIIGGLSVEENLQLAQIEAHALHDVALAVVRVQVAAREEGRRTGR